MMKYSEALDFISNLNMCNHECNNCIFVECIDDKKKEALKAIKEENKKNRKRAKRYKKKWISLYIPMKDRQAQSYKFKYDPNYGDANKCICGHSYYRHFDSYDNMRPIGCKYCGCSRFEPVNK